MGNVVLVADKGRKYSQKIAIYGLNCAIRMVKNINFVKFVIVNQYICINNYFMDYE